MPTARTVPFQLPPPPPVLVGRDAELEQTLAALRRSRAVWAVVGPGGIGKSTLALHAAHRAAPSFPGGCLYVDLHGASAGITPADPHEVLSTFLRALGVRSAPVDTAEASALFRTVTAGQSLLVVLDNAAAAAQVRPLLPSGPHCATLVTSRWKLADLDATGRLAIEPLPEPAAHELLEHLCGADRLAAAPDAAHRIVRLCGGLPLALRIVGARAATGPDATALATLAERVADDRRHLDELAVGDLSVRVSLDLGYRTFIEAADPARRRTARLFRLAALPDWVDAAPAACAVLVGEPAADVERALDLLCDAHLLEPAGAGRFRYHDSVRIFAREQAAAEADGAAEALPRLAASLFASAARAGETLFPHDSLPYRPLRDGGPSLLPPDLTQDDAWQWLERERTNLLLIATQEYGAGRSLPGVRDVGLVVAKYLDYAGHFADQIRFGQLSATAAQRLGDRTGTAFALNTLAIGHLRNNRLAEAIVLLERVLVMQRDLSHRAGEATCLNNLGNAHRDLADLDTALRYLRESLAIRHELGDRYKEGSVLDNIGIVLRQRGDIAGALANHEAGLAITRDLGDRHRESLMLFNLAETEYIAGDHRRAVEHARHSVDLCRELRLTHNQGLGLRLLGDALAALGHRDRARECHDHARVLLAEDVAPPD